VLAFKEICLKMMRSRNSHYLRADLKAASESMARLWAKTVSFDSIRVGDQLPILVKWDTQDSINQFAELALPGQPAGWGNLCPEEEFAEQGIFGGTVVPGLAMVAYIAELLEKAFPIAGIVARGSRLEMRATAPVRPEDTITFTGEVVSKGEEQGLRLVECEIIAENQQGRTVARAVAVVSL
jgi:acyl dehydratase